MAETSVLSPQGSKHGHGQLQPKAPLSPQITTAWHPSARHAKHVIRISRRDPVRRCRLAARFLAIDEVVAHKRLLAGATLVEIGSAKAAAGTTKENHGNR